MTAAARIAAVIARFDSPAMRRDLAFWYDLPVDAVNEIALSIGTK